MFLYVCNISQTLRVYNSRIIRIKNEKLSGYNFYMNMKTQGDFQICISVPLNAIKISSSNYAKFIFHSYVFQLLSGCTSQNVLIVKLTIYKQIFLKLVAPSTKILLIMILHYCHFKTGKPDRATTIYRYLIRRL